MSKFVILTLMVVVASIAIGGCSSPDDSVVMTVTDNDGVLAPREVTAGYVNDRMLHMPPWVLPQETGDEGRRAFLREIANKEMLVIASLRSGVENDSRVGPAMEFYEDQHAMELLARDLIIEPTTMTRAEVEDYYRVRETHFVLEEIVTSDLETIEEAKRRILKDGEDFGDVAREVSVAATAREGGKTDTKVWLDQHPYIREAIAELDVGDVTDIIEIPPSGYFFMRVHSIKPPGEQLPLEGPHYDRIKMEAEKYHQQLLDIRTRQGWVNGANIEFDEEGLAVAVKRHTEKYDEINPPRDTPLSFEDRRALAMLEVLPDYTDEEAAMPLVTFSVGGRIHEWTNGDYRDSLSLLPGVEQPKGGGVRPIEAFVERKIVELAQEQEIRNRGYRTSAEMREYLATRREEMLVDLFYEAEVNNVVGTPTEQELRDYYAENPETFTEPEKVDIRVILVGTEDQANRVRQMIVEGGKDFGEMVAAHSIDTWSQSRGGMIEGVFMGQQTFPDLQEPAFALEIGEVSEPIEVSAGYYIITPVKRIPPKLLPYDDVIQRVAGHLLAERKEARLQVILDELEETCTVEIVEANLQNMKSPDQIIAETKRD